MQSNNSIRIPQAAIRNTTSRTAEPGNQRPQRRRRGRFRDPDGVDPDTRIDRQCVLKTVRTLCRSLDNGRKIKESALLDELLEKLALLRWQQIRAQL